MQIILLFGKIVTEVFDIEILAFILVGRRMKGFPIRPYQNSCWRMKLFPENLNWAAGSGTESTRSPFPFVFVFVSQWLYLSLFIGICSCFPLFCFCSGNRGRPTHTCFGQKVQNDSLNSLCNAAPPTPKSLLDVYLYLSSSLCILASLSPMQYCHGARR